MQDWFEVRAKVELCKKLLRLVAGVFTIVAMPWLHPWTASSQQIEKTFTPEKRYGAPQTLHEISSSWTT